MDLHDIKLFEDDWGVRHWSYRMRGVLTLCGSHNKAAMFGGVDVPSERAPTCIQCIAILIREENEW